MLLYTQKCNIACSHCVYDCSPDKNQKLDFNKTISLVKELHKFKIMQLILAGGEPLLYFDEVLKIISTAKKHKVDSILLTNGFWASSKKKAEETVSKLVSAGLNELVVSNDEFHSRFIPMTYTTNIFDAAKKHHLKASLKIVYSKNNSVFDFLHKNQNYFSKKNKKIALSFQQVLPIGRAAQNIPKENFNACRNTKTFDKKCDFLGNLVINYDGRVFACCNIFPEENPVFCLESNFNSNSLPFELINSYQKSLLVFYLRTKGPYFIQKLAEKHKLNKVNAPERLLKGYVNSCDYCQLNLSQYSQKELNFLLLNEFEKNKK